MSTKIINLIMAILTTSACFGQEMPAQLTPAQQAILKKYQAGQKPQANSGANKYQSPEIYNSPDSLKQNNINQLPDTNLSKSTIAISDTTAPDSQELKLFGYDVFAGDQQLFDPDLASLPPVDYTLGPGDNILVNIWGRVDLELNLTVDREGKVFIPKVGELVALGCTLDQFKQNLDSRLSQIYSEYQLAVAFGKIRQIRIYVFGEVKRPGGYTVSSLATLLHALYQAGGINDNGSLRSIQLIRNTKVVRAYDLYDLMLKGDNSGDLKLVSGDVVYAPVTGPRVSISGEIRRPAIYELKGDEKITDLLKLAGGTTSTAFLQSVSIDRVSSGDNRILKDINITDSTILASQDIAIQDGDKITVPSIYDFHVNMVKLYGHVKHPGAFGLVDSMRISNLIAKGEQLKENTYTSRADLFRIGLDGKKSVLPVCLDSIIAGNKTADIFLTARDSLFIYSYQQVTRKTAVRIQGEVKNPGEYQLYHGMKLSDLIFLSGNLIRGSYLLRAEIARATPGKPTDLIYVNLEDILVNGKLESDLILEEDDQVFIRQIPEWRPMEMAVIEGEVRFPGKYAIQSKDEKLSDLIARAGGLTDVAFPEGAIYYRKSIADDVARRNIGQIIRSTSETTLDSIGRPTKEFQIDYDPKLLNRIIIDLPKIVNSPCGPEDIVLADSDHIFIPTKPSGVQIIGAVAANGTIAFAPKKSLKYYVEQAGGFAPEADKSAIRLVKPNGKVFYGNQATHQRLALGDAILIPARYKHKTDWGKTIGTAATIVGSLATTIFVVDRLR